MIAFPLLSIAKVELERGNAKAAERASGEALSRFESAVPGTFLEGVDRCLIGLSLEQQGRPDEGGAMAESSHPLMATGNIPDPYPELCRLP